MHLTNEGDFPPNLCGKSDPYFKAEKRESIRHDLCAALERNELTLHYQAKVDLSSGAFLGAEALTRWTHPKRGPVPPTQFIPVAEESGLIMRIGAWMIRKACTQAQVWLNAGFPAMTMTVNISEIQLDEDFPKRLLAILSATGLNSRHLELDVTSRALMTNSGRTRSALRSVRNTGVHISADNLGATYPNFSMLRKVPIDSMKIDRSFVRGISNNPEARIKVGAMISMGHRLNLPVIAEGVETSEQLEYLWEHGCDQALGYYFGRPAPSEQLLFDSARMVN
jgi:EAL domain-containing protein (putative c-di-GMP-specific phosphodiesterase class I)